jgi:protocatechuate 3,4-dioxygenase beta subunit
VVGLAGIVSTGAFAKEQLAPTPQETTGPYFPVHAPTEQDFDLTHVANGTGVPLGALRALKGRVLRRDGSPIANASVFIWQANAAGRYAHPLHNVAAPIDPNFQGVARLTTGADGAYALRTVKPGGYAVAAGGQRAPHIHFEVTSADYRLTTQMYFPDEKLNAQDLLIPALSSRNGGVARVTCKPTAAPAKDVLGFEWDIVLLQT